MAAFDPKQILGTNAFNSSRHELDAVLAPNFGYFRQVVGQASNLLAQFVEEL
jgi:hypothetical protein